MPFDKRKNRWRSTAALRRGWLIASLAFTAIVFAARTHVAPADFLEQVFDGTPPQERKLWLHKEHRETLRDILGHQSTQLRVPYWRRKDRTAFILEEIGKTRPITIGVVVDGGKVERVSILIYRESRGGEVHRKRFVEQYKGIQLTSERKLDKRIDGITGATISSNAVTRATRVALYYDGLLEELGK